MWEGHFDMKRWYSRINKQNIIGLFSSKKMEYRSVNSVLEIDDEVNYPVEFLNSFNPPGFPLHLLTLEIGTPIMLLSNHSPPNLCHETRQCITDRIRWNYD